MSDRNHRGRRRLCGGLSGKYFWRCAAFCALLFGFMVVAEPLAFTVLADEVTEESIKEKENQIEAAKSDVHVEHEHALAGAAQRTRKSGRQR